MPIKHQSDSYRHRGGVRFECWGDMLEGEHAEQVQAAQEAIANFRTEGRRGFYESHKDDDGEYVRVFVEAEDVRKSICAPGCECRECQTRAKNLRHGHLLQRQKIARAEAKCAHWMAEYVKLKDAGLSGEKFLKRAAQWQLKANRFREGV